MSFSEAITYPFKSENIPKILTIILVFLLIVAVVVVGGIMSQAPALLLVAIPVVIAYSIFVGGYTVEVVRSVMAGESILPQPQLGRDIKRGIVVIIGGIVHFIPLIALFIFAAVMFGPSLENSVRIDTYGNIDTSGLSDALGLICGSAIVAIVFGFFISNTFNVGIVRYAVDGHASGLFDIGSNFSTVLSNLGAVFGLFIRSFGIGIIYYIIGNAVDAFFDGALTEAFNPYGGQPGIGIMLMVTIYGIVTLTLGLMNQLSTSHLLAGFGQEVGISTRKTKHDDYDFD